MSDLEPDRWTLTVEFDSLAAATAAGSDIGADCPLGEAAAFYAHVREYWDLLSEELDECTRLSGETVTVTTDIIDSLEDPLKWVMMHTVPRRVELVREESRMR